MNNKIKCIYCGHELTLNYYLKHLRTLKHINTKKLLIDKSLLFMPKDVNDIIFKYWDNNPIEIKMYRRRKLSIRENIRRRIQETRQRTIDNKWYNKYPRQVKNIIYSLLALLT